MLALAAVESAAAQNCACPADATGNGVVDGADLAVVLGAWGTSSPAADLNGDGLVDGADIAIVLGNWGVCATPPSNDCAGAQSIGPGSHPFCTSNATTDGPSLPPGLCGSTTAQIHKDVWYDFDAQSNGTMVLETCTGTAFDSVIAVYSSAFPNFAPCPTAAPGQAILIGCNDNGCQQQSKLTLEVTGGFRYKIRIGGASANAAGPGVLTLSFTHPGESCENSIIVNSVPSSVTILGNTSDNPSAMLPKTCSAGIVQGPAEWITYIAPTGGLLVIDTCDPYTNFDTLVHVLRDELDGNCWTTAIDCNDDSFVPGCDLNGAPLLSLLEVPCTQGEVFRIVVTGYNGAKGKYALTVTRFRD